MLFNLLFPLWILAYPLISFGPGNDKEISQLNPLFAVRLTIWLLMVRVTLGLSVLIVDGLRTPAEQLALHKQDSRNPASPGKHGTGDAVDVNFFRDGVNVLRKASSPAQWAAVYALAKLCGISNGSGFKGYPDNNHFYRA